MSVKCTATYEGGLICNVLHEQSGSMIQTEAPLDNKGKGTKFSPTDLVASALGACILTIMGIVADNENIDMKGVKVEVTKEMSKDMPRRISKIDANIIFPENINLTDVQKKKLEAAAKGCPVKATIRQDTEINLNFVY